MAGLGGSIASGIESGFGIAMRGRQQALAEEDRTRRQRLEDEAIGIQREDRSRKLAMEDEDRALNAINDEYEQMRLQGEGLLKQYGGAPPPEIATPYTQRFETLSRTRNDMLRKRYEPIVQRREQEARDLASRLETGQVRFEDVPDRQFYDALVASTRRDPADFVSPDGKAPSRVGQAATDIRTGIETGNEGMVLRGANVLFEPELKVGVGDTGRHGGKIVGKRIVKFIPAPDDPSQLLPVLRVYTSDGKVDTAGEAKRMELIRQEDPDAPDGATGYYLAPVTEDRTPYGNPKPLDMQKAMDYAARAETLSAFLARPEARAKYERGAKEAGPAGGGDFLSAFYGVKGKIPAKSPVEFKAVKPGERLVGIDTATGKPTGQVIEGPKKEEKRVGLAAQIDAVREFAEKEGIDDLGEAAKRMQDMGLLRAPKVGKGAGAGGGAGGGKAPNMDLTGEEFLATLSKTDRVTVKGLADGSIKPDSISTKGGRREQMLAWAKQYKGDANLTGRSTKGTTLPAKQMGLLTEARSNAGTLGSLAESFKSDYASKGVLGLGADLSLRGKSVLGTDKESVNWWKNYRKMAELVERHEMFGAALTATERQSWQSADIDPSMDADVIQTNLATRAAIAKKVLENTAQDLIDAGYDEQAIRKIGGRDAAMPVDAGTGAPKQPGLQKPAPAGAAPAAVKPNPAVAPFRLPADQKAAEAAYARLAPGTRYIAPDGSQRVKQ